MLCYWSKLMIKSWMKAMKRRLTRKQSSSSKVRRTEMCRWICHKLSWATKKKTTCNLSWKIMLGLHSLIKSRMKAMKRSSRRKQISKVWWTRSYRSICHQRSWATNWKTTWSLSWKIMLCLSSFNSTESKKNPQCCWSMINYSCCLHYRLSSSIMDLSVSCSSDVLLRLISCGRW